MEWGGWELSGYVGLSRNPRARDAPNVEGGHARGPVAVAVDRERAVVVMRVAGGALLDSDGDHLLGLAVALRAGEDVEGVGRAQEQGQGGRRRGGDGERERGAPHGGRSEERRALIRAVDLCMSRFNKWISSVNAVRRQRSGVPGGLGWPGSVWSRRTGCGRGKPNAFGRPHGLGLRADPKKKCGLASTNKKKCGAG